MTAVCAGCGTYHPDLNLPKVDALSEKQLAMDDRDIRELIAAHENQAQRAIEDGDRYSRGIAAGLRIANDSLSRYIAPVAS